MKFKAGDLIYWKKEKINSIVIQVSASKEDTEEVWLLMDKDTPKDYHDYNQIESYILRSVERYTRKLK